MPQCAVAAGCWEATLARQHATAKHLHACRQHEMGAECAFLQVLHAKTGTPMLMAILLKHPAGFELIQGELTQAIAVHS